MASLFPKDDGALRRAVLALGLALGAMGLSAADSVERIVPDAGAISRLPAVSLPPPPAWASSSGVSLWTADDILAEFRKVTDKPPQLIYVEPRFVRPDHPWLVSFIRWFQKLDKPLNLHYEDELFDCDKYSRCFVAFADLLAQKGRESRASICVGWATVFNQGAFGGVAAGGAHAVVIVGTSEGLFVVEPQTGSMSPLRSYPNRDEFVEVYF